jgi:hypothetical protein
VEGDAGGEASATDAGFCAARSSTTTFCADFDDGNLQRGWDIGAPLTTGGGELSLSQTDGSSPPDALSAFVPPIGETSDKGRASLCRKFGPNPYLSLAFAVNVLEADRGPFATSVASLRFGNTPETTLYVEIWSEGGEWFLHQMMPQGPGVPPSKLTQTPKLSVWTRIELSARVTESDGGVLVRAEASAEGHLVASSTVPWPTTNLDTEACIGVVYVSSSSSPFHILYDDVTVSVTPPA